MARPAARPVTSAGDGRGITGDTGNPPNGTRAGAPDRRAKGRRVVGLPADDRTTLDRDDGIRGDRAGGVRDRRRPGHAGPGDTGHGHRGSIGDGHPQRGESALAPGTELEPGDTVIADSLGSVILRFGSREARLAGGASVRIDELGNGGVVIEQLDGRVYHRMFGTDAGSYVVATGSVTWTAIGRAFDLDREPVHGSTLERVTGTAVDRSVSLVGPSLAGTLVEGRQAVVLLGTETPEVSTAETPATWFADPWVASNARQDRAAAEGRRATAESRLRHSPRNRGGRRSRNAAMPSAWSARGTRRGPGGRPRSRAAPRGSTSRRCSSACFVSARATRRAARQPHGERLRLGAAGRRPARRARPARTVRRRPPRAARSSGPARRPSRRRRAAAGATSHPSPGSARPDRTRGGTTPSVDAIRMSQANASDAPAPAATPLIAPMIGLPSRAHREEQRVVASADLVRERQRVGLEALPQVLAGAERPARPGQDDRADGVVVGDRLERRAEGLLQRARSGR